MSLNPVDSEMHSMQHYVIVSDLRQVSGFLWVLHFPPPIKLISAQILKFWNFFVMELIVTKVSGSIPAYFLYQLSFQVKLVQEEALVVLL
jgi:hypothetical protein